MSTEATMTGGMTASAEAKKTFAVCFAALVATSFCFILRAFSIGAWGKEFDLSQTQMGELAGVGLWPFAISIVRCRSPAAIRVSACGSHGTALAMWPCVGANPGMPCSRANVGIALFSSSPRTTPRPASIR